MVSSLPFISLLKKYKRNQEIEPKQISFGQLLAKTQFCKQRVRGKGDIFLMSFLLFSIH